MPAPFRSPILAHMSDPAEPREAPRGRIRFLDLEFHPRPDGQGQVSVRMDWQGREVSGEASGIVTREGDLRMGAQASLETLHELAGHLVQAELVGVKAVRAFDAWVVIASVRARAWVPRPARTRTNSPEAPPLPCWTP